MKIESMKIEGMTCDHCQMRRFLILLSFASQAMACGHCQIRIEKALKAIDGIHDAKIMIDKGYAHVSYDQDVVDTRSLKENIIKIGFKVSN